MALSSNLSLAMCAGVPPPLNASCLLAAWNHWALNGPPFLKCKG
uniref:Uncharacterized protein n=1 Tax=Arundo donax TaxID=35708 RepID=A0A0A9ARY3_ARUDO